MVFRATHQVLLGFRRDAHPMAVMTGVVGALSAFYHDAMDFSDVQHRNVSFNRLVAKMPTIVAMAYKYNTGAPFMYPDNELDYTANFMRMMFGNPAKSTCRIRCWSIPWTPSSPPRRPRAERFDLHRAPGRFLRRQPVRLYRRRYRLPVGSGHGGANEACLQMLEEIGDVSRVNEYIKRAKDKNDSFKLMGFGHRVYKNFDPAPSSCAKSAAKCLPNWACRTTASSSWPWNWKDRPGRRLLRREEALPERRFLPGIVQKAIGIPTEMFTCIFALARTVGWMTQWEEMITDPEYKIGRPRQLYVGAARRDNVVPLAQRG